MGVSKGLMWGLLIGGGSLLLLQTQTKKKADAKKSKPKPEGEIPKLEPKPKPSLYRETTDATFDQDIQGEAVFLYLYMDGCEACEQAAPSLEKIAAAYPNIAFLKANGPKNPKMEEAIGDFVAFPSFVAFKNGQLYKKALGFKPEGDVVFVQPDGAEGISEDTPIALADLMIEMKGELPPPQPDPQPEPDATLPSGTTEGLSGTAQWRVVKMNDNLFGAEAAVQGNDWLALESEPGKFIVYNTPQEAADAAVAALKEAGFAS